MIEDLVSVIIPAFNCETTIESAIRSMLGQTHRNLEVIVVNDKSTDSTEQVVREIEKKEPRTKLVNVTEDDPFRFDAKLQRNINAGYSARNLGFKHVQGKYITFQDADDASFLNRVETQLALLKKHDAAHVTIDWIKFTEERIGKKFDVDAFIREYPDFMIGPEELYRLSQETKGIAMFMLGKYHAKVPFHIKRARIINKLFFRSVKPYPGVSGPPLFRRDVIEKVRFRKLADRVWPSFMGRGADRDFNFQVAETFKNSYVFLIPLYLWRVKNENPRLADGIEQFIV